MKFSFRVIFYFPSFIRKSPANHKSKRSHHLKTRFTLDAFYFKIKFQLKLLTQTDCPINSYWIYELKKQNGHMDELIVIFIRFKSI